MRLILACLAAFAVAALGAAILGEYQFSGITGAAAGLILGIFVAEAAIAVNGGGSRALVVVCAALTAASLLWAIHASIGARDSIPADIPSMGWAAIALGVVGAGVRARSSGTPAAGTRTERGRTPGSAPDVPSPTPEHPQG
ncbi:MAG: hypothetical protein JWP02_3865 [Acidimicrobiales bacterium]|nr:hypothetical protein [Acidimicrobiales bacterium]